MESNKYGVVSPRTEEELIGYLRSLVNIDWGETPSLSEVIADPSEATDNARMKSGYELSADALWKGAAATFEYVAHVLGVTGAQAGWAVLRFVKAERHIDGPFAILDGEQLLYPQYDLERKVAGWLRDWRVELAPMARERIAEAEAEARDEGMAPHPAVLARWREIAALGDAGEAGSSATSAHSDEKGARLS